LRLVQRRDRPSVDLDSAAFHLADCIHELLHAFGREISRISLTNYGVYFEAGVAVGPGIPVIGTCRADYLTRLHFDIRHINTIKWEPTEQLACDLAMRISGVVGDGPLPTTETYRRLCCTTVTALT